MPLSTIVTASGNVAKPNHFVYLPLETRQKWNINQTYFLAQSARGKLSKEAAKADRDLRLIVGHASMLDSLLFHLHSAEQKRWFNRSLSSTQDDEDPEEIYIENILEESEEEWGAEWKAEDTESSDAEAESDDEIQ